MKRPAPRDRQPQHEQRAAARRRARPRTRAAVRLGDLAHDRQPEAGARPPARAPARGRSGRRRAARSSGAMPGPWSRTDSSPSRSPHVDRRRPAGSTWPRCRAGSPPRGPAARARRPRASGRARSAKRVARRVARARARPPPRRARRGAPPRARAPGSSSRARSTRSDDQRGQLARAGRRRRRAASRGRARRARRPRRSSTSRLVRSEVSGVRSSCDASATSRRCARWECSSASSIVLKLARQARELVVAAGLDAARQVARARDVLGGLGQLRDGLAPPRAWPAGRAAARAPTPASDRRSRAPMRSVPSVALDLGQRPRDDDREVALRRARRRAGACRRSSRSLKNGSRRPAASARRSASDTSEPGAAGHRVARAVRCR